MKNKLIWMILSLLGFAATGCEEEDRVEYGCPYVTFSIKGKVTNEAGDPIPGIQVGIKNEYPTALTDDKGAFAFTKSTAFALPDPAVLQFTDIDGPENGSYATGEIEVAFTKNPAVPTDGWYQGDYTANDVTVVLKEVQSEE